jgi:pimeloyl-ACP methyl ester carboxylesterase
MESGGLCPPNPGVFRFWLAPAGQPGGRPLDTALPPVCKAALALELGPRRALYPPVLIYYNKVDKGGHYAAWEQPQLFSEEVRAGFRPLRYN